MIEIQIKLVREQSAVYLAGETLECFIIFTNKNRDEGISNLAWATVSIQCFYNSSLAKKETLESSNIVSATALGNESNVIVATQPKFLFCDLKLPCDGVKSYFYKEELPKAGPPTFRGTKVKFFYKISIATQRVGSKVQILYVPIRVLPFCMPLEGTNAILCDDTNEEVAPANPFIEKKQSESLKEDLMHCLQSLTSRRCPSFYVITNKRGRIGRFCLFKINYKLGEDIVGTLSFSTRSVDCVQYSVSLQLEEMNEIQSKGGVEKKSQYKTTVKIFNKQHEMCVGLEESQLILAIPLHATPSFKTDKVEVKWRLHFQFVTLANTEITGGNDDEKAETWCAPENVEIETMVWNLPICVSAANPLQIPQQREKHVLRIK